MTGSNVREMIKSSDVYIWQVAKELGCSDVTFSKKLRFDFTDEEVQKIERIIEDLTK